MTPALLVGKPHRGNRPLPESRLSRHGLAVGTPAPGFTLPRLDGGRLSLAAYRGRKTLLVFSDPRCAPCDAIGPRLEQAHRHSGDVAILMVSRGDAELNHANVAEHGLTFPILLQRHWEISRRYAIFATPVGYLIDEQGLIAADVAVGAQAVRALLEPPMLESAVVAAVRQSPARPPESRSGVVGGVSARRGRPRGVTAAARSPCTNGC